MAQRTILMLGQGHNTVWGTFASPPAQSWYGMIQGTFFQDAGYTNTTGTAGGAVAECAFACVLSRLFHTVGPISATGPTTLTSNVNVGGAVAVSSAAGAGAGNLAATTPATANTNYAYWYDATDLDAITAGQLIGLMQTLTACTSSPVNPALGVVCDSVNQGFCSPFVFAGLGGSIGGSINGGTLYGRVGGTGATGGAGPVSVQTVFTNDYCANAFVASWLQWTPGSSTDSTAGHLKTAAFATNATQTLTASSLAATMPSPAYTGLMHDTTDIAAIPAGNYSGYIWTGTMTSSQLRVGNHSAHMRPAGNNATMIFTGQTTAGGQSTTGFNTTYQSFGGTRSDAGIVENMTSIPTAGVFSNLWFQTGSQAYGGTPLTTTVQNGPNTGDTGAGSGTISTTVGANFVNTSLSTGAMTAPSTWYFDATDIAAFTRFNGFLLAISNPSGGSAGSLTFTGMSINFTAPAHQGLTTQGVG